MHNIDTNKRITANDLCVIATEVSNTEKNFISYVVASNALNCAFKAAKRGLYHTHYCVNDLFEDSINSTIAILTDLGYRVICEPKNNKTDFEIYICWDDRTPSF